MVFEYNAQTEHRKSIVGWPGLLRLRILDCIVAIVIRIKADDAMNYHLTAQDIMQTEVETILGDLSAAEAVATMRFSGTRSLLVVPRQEDEPYGIVSYSDIVYAVLAEGKNAALITIDDIASTPAYAIRPDDAIQAIAQHFKKHGIGHAPVVDANSKLIGVVSMTDLITEAISEPE